MYYSIMKNIMLIISFLFDVASGSGTSNPTLQTTYYKPLYTKEHLSKEVQILSTTSPSKLSCSGACFSNIECKAFSFNGKAGFCQLYKKGPKTSCRSTEPDRRVYYVRVQTPGTTKLQPDQQNDTSHHSPSGRVLFANPTTRASLSQLTLGREISTVNTYMFIKPLVVLSLQYSRSLQSLFIVQIDPDNIFSVYIGKRKTSVIRNGRYSTLSVDGEKGLLFAVGDSRDIYRMTTQGQLLRRFYHPSQIIFVRDIATDPQHELVYVVLYKSNSGNCDVISLKYADGDADFLFERHMLYAAFDQMSHTLVYSQNNQLMSYDPSGKKQKHSLLTAFDEIRGLAAYEGTLYFVDGDSLVEFSHRNEMKPLVDLPGNDHYQLCIID